MIAVGQWLQSRPGAVSVELFDTTDGLTVSTKLVGAKAILRRSPAMERAMIELIENGLRDEKWEGLLYVMGVFDGLEFTPLYIGKAERRGVKHAISSNIKRIRSNTQRFARWGDNLEYHIGDLSHALFNSPARRAPRKKYARWAQALFDSAVPPVLKRPVFLLLVSWREGDAGPSGLAGSLPAVEKEVIALASLQFPSSLLNVDGI